MPNEPLEPLIKVRRRILDEARRALTECLEVECRADEARTRLEERISKERELAESLEVGDTAVEVFGAWLRKERERLQVLGNQCDECRAATAQARAALNIVRSAYEAASEALARKLEANRETAQGRERQVLDEIALRVSKAVTPARRCAE